MNTYTEAQQVERALRTLINECIEKHPIVKSAIKARKARVVGEPSDGLVKVALIGDVGIGFKPDGTPTVQENAIVLPYSTRLSANDLSPGKIVSVWYNYSMNNAIVMQNNDWTV